MCFGKDNTLSFLSHILFIMPMFLTYKLSFTYVCPKFAEKAAFGHFSASAEQLDLSDIEKVTVSVFKIETIYAECPLPPDIPSINHCYDEVKSGLKCCWRKG